MCAVSSSLTDFSQKLFVYSEAKPDTAVFNFYTYLFSAIILLISYTVCKSKDSEPVKKTLPMPVP